MKTIYLIRHGETVPVGNRCIGHTDLPLCNNGLYQAERLREWFSDKKLSAVYSSPLSRCIRTADIISEGRFNVEICPELIEMNAGAWENLSFDDIRKLYPREYEERGRHLGTVAPPGGESVMEAGIRLGSFVEKLARRTEGEFAAVSHSGAIRGFLCKLLNLNPDDVFSIRQSLGGVSLLEWDGEKFAVLSVGIKPDRWPSESEQKSLKEKCGTTEKISAHCAAVASLADEWAQCLRSRNIPVETELLRAACNLHDIAHSEKSADHAGTCAKMLDDAGYPEVAKLILQHNDLKQDASLEAKLLLLADKRVQETEKVTLEKRFEASKAKCRSNEAISAWQRRYTSALSVENELKRMLDTDEL